MNSAEILFKECMKNPKTKKAFIGALGMIADGLKLVQPVTHGEWLPDEYELKAWSCSECGHIKWEDLNDANYCECCGAKMQEVEE